MVLFYAISSLQIKWYPESWHDIVESTLIHYA